MEAPRRNPPAPRARILLVEDDEDTRELPVDLAQFLTDIAARLPRPAAAEPVDDEPRPHLEAILYVSSGSPASLRARRHLEDLLSRLNVPGLRFEVCDIARDVRRAEAERVVYTPTLARRSPGPPVWIVGDPTRSSLLADLLTVPPS